MMSNAPPYLASAHKHMHACVCVQMQDKAGHLTSYKLQFTHTNTHLSYDLCQSLEMFLLLLETMQLLLELSHNSRDGIGHTLAELQYRRVGHLQY